MSLSKFELKEQVEEYLEELKMIVTATGLEHIDKKALIEEFIELGGVYYGVNLGMTQTAGIDAKRPTVLSDSLGYDNIEDLLWDLSIGKTVSDLLNIDALGETNEQ